MNSSFPASLLNRGRWQGTCGYTETCQDFSLFLSTGPLPFIVWLYNMFLWPDFSCFFLHQVRGISRPSLSSPPQGRWWSTPTDLSWFPVRSTVLLGGSRKSAGRRTDFSWTCLIMDDAFLATVPCWLTEMVTAVQGATSVLPVSLVSAPCSPQSRGSILPVSV